MAGVLLKRDRAIVLLSLAVAAAIAWAYLLAGAGMSAAPMKSMGGQMMAMAPRWSLAYAALVFVMWATMMVAMMLPSAAPTILLASALMRQRGGRQAFGPTGLFVLGYLAIWTGFSLVATIAQWALSRVGLLSTTMASDSRAFAAMLLVAAGLYQWTPAKRACLAGCRSPAEQITRFWPRGRAGPLLAGLWNGCFCLGCCWLLMALLFVGGVMNLGWIALIAILVLIEKVGPASGWLSRAVGLGLVAGGVVFLLVR